MISERLKSVILTELDLDDFEIKDETRADEIPGWDSLNHINVILAIEKSYNIRFKSVEVLRLKNVGGLQKLVDLKCKEK